MASFHTNSIHSLESNNLGSFASGALDSIQNHWPTLITTTVALGSLNYAIKYYNNRPDKLFSADLQKWVDSAPPGEHRKAAQYSILKAYERKCTHLSIDGFGLTSLPACLKSLTNLKTLSVQNNRLNKLDFRGLPNLKEADATNNHIKAVLCGDMTCLETLHLEKNCLEKLHLKNTPALQFLTVGSNQLNSLILDNAPQLERLYAEQNRLQELDLRAHDNELKELRLESAIALKYLKIERNRIVRLDFRNTPQLEWALINHNMMLNFLLNKEGFYPCLKKFDASHNLLISLPQQFVHWPRNCQADFQTNAFNHQTISEYLIAIDAERLLSDAQQGPQVSFDNPGMGSAPSSPASSRQDAGILSYSL